MALLERRVCKKLFFAHAVNAACAAKRQAAHPTGSESFFGLIWPYVREKNNSVYID